MYLFFFFNDTATTEIYTLSLHDALPIYETGYMYSGVRAQSNDLGRRIRPHDPKLRSEEHTSELQSRSDLVCRLLLEKKNTANKSWLTINVISVITPSNTQYTFSLKIRVP